MASRTDLIDRIDHLRDQLRLLALAARSLEDSDDANAMHLGVSQAAMKADEIKALLVNELGRNAALQDHAAEERYDGID